MRKFNQTLLLITVIIGSSFVVILSVNGNHEFSMAQQRGQLQDDANATQDSKFLKNSTSFGNATADLKIKHAPQFSTISIQPWPIVKPGQEFNVTGTLVDKITLRPIPDSDISFLYESASEKISPSSLKAMDNQHTDIDGKFTTTATAPTAQGIISVTGVFNGSGLYHSGASDPALVIVSNSTLPS
jgi:hypothetical protein